MRLPKTLRILLMILLTTFINVVSIMFTVLFVPNWGGFAIGCGLGGNLSILTWYLVVRSGMLGPVPGIPGG